MTAPVVERESELDIIRRLAYTVGRRWEQVRILRRAVQSLLAIAEACAADPMWPGNLPDATARYAISDARTALDLSHDAEVPA